MLTSNSSAPQGHDLPFNHHATLTTEYIPELKSAGHTLYGW